MHSYIYWCLAYLIDDNEGKASRQYFIIHHGSFIGIFLPWIIAKLGVKAFRDISRNADIQQRWRLIVLGIERSQCKVEIIS